MAIIEPSQKTLLQIKLKYLDVSTPYGRVNAKQKDLENIKDLIALEGEKEFFDYFRLSDNTLTIHELTKTDLIIIRDIITDERNSLKKEIWEA
jgi:hypothetical protein